MTYLPDNMMREELPYYREHVDKVQEIVGQLNEAVAQNDFDRDRWLDLLTQLNEEFYCLGIPEFQQTTSDC